jgi:hypothetical protein
VVAGSDWVIDIGPGAGEEGGRIVAAGPPAEVAHSLESRTAPYLDRFLDLSSKLSLDDDAARVTGTMDRMLRLSH